MFGFLKKNKKEVVEEIKYYIPKEHVLAVCKLSDLIGKNKRYREAQFRLWSIIESIFPDLEIKEGGWTLVFGNSTNIYIRKRNILD